MSEEEEGASSAGFMLRGPAYSQLWSRTLRTTDIYGHFSPLWQLLGI